MSKLNFEKKYLEELNQFKDSFNFVENELNFYMNKLHKQLNNNSDFSDLELKLKKIKQPNNFLLTN